MRKFIPALLIIFIVSSVALAQESENFPEIAVRLIEETNVYGGTLLDLSNFNLEALPTEIGILENLHELYLSGNQLSALPDEIANLTDLTRLDLSMNQFSEVPPEIGQLGNLLMLTMRENQIRHLPLEIGNLSHLRWLDMSNNHIETLPLEIGNLSNLCLLDMSGNDLRYLPHEVGQIAELAIERDCERGFYGLFVEGNPLISPPPEVIEQGTSAILDYLNSLDYIENLIALVAHVLWNED